MKRMYTHTVAPRIEFDRTSPVCYEVHYDRQVLIGHLTKVKAGWIFRPIDLDGLSAYTMKALIEKIEWLETRVTEEDRIY